MHIPDGVLSPLVSGVAYVVSIVFLVYCSRRFFAGAGFQGAFTDTRERVSLVSVTAAAVFAAQMLNWPIPGGTSAHLVGGALSALILGPEGGFLALFLVLLVQSLVFGDGGITALGANVLNMAIVDVFAGYGIYKMVTSILGGKLRGKQVGSFFAGWIGIALAALVCGIEIGSSPQFGYPLAVTIPVMFSWHLALGLIEGVITMFVVRYALLHAPETIYIGGGSS